jgi:hypothetical protein
LTSEPTTGEIARPKPQSGGLAKFNGYADSAGSACIKHSNVLGSSNSPPNANGDVQLQINLTSDSDALQGHRGDLARARIGMT